MYSPAVSLFFVVFGTGSLDPGLLADLEKLLLEYLLAAFPEQFHIRGETNLAFITEGIHGEHLGVFNIPLTGIQEYFLHFLSVGIVGNGCSYPADDPRIPYYLVSLEELAAKSRKMRSCGVSYFVFEFRN